jgi:hypothetical protein
MDWPTFALARQLLMEMRVGSRVREAQREEDEQFKRTRSALETRR